MVCFGIFCLQKKRGDQGDKWEEIAPVKYVSNRGYGAIFGGQPKLESEVIFWERRFVMLYFSGGG